MQFILVLIAILAGGGGGDTPETEGQVATGSGLVAEPQEATGRFLTATEVRPILNATKANWVAVREYDGRDLVYFTHLLSWRCGLAQLEYAVNGEALQVFDLPPCHVDTNAPNALTPDDGLPYVGYPLGSVASLDVRITYDDLETDAISVERRAVLMP